MHWYGWGWQVAHGEKGERGLATCMRLASKGIVGFGFLNWEEMGAKVRFLSMRRICAKKGEIKRPVSEEKQE